eukprot:CAMPEP_0175155286 /NCGR_PEP_ID=MMETSP0087-20121206/20883_1 /TAXON_ID=136419 /ORGANISM="Unknown Unknown, Strain D1" /LENGTH=88 /DNA_ID=CAMNT_0016442409 /DNA_START=1 /DNA_END=267 /DNA_ORIENTATION=+
MSDPDPLADCDAETKNAVELIINEKNRLTKEANPHDFEWKCTGLMGPPNKDGDVLNIEMTICAGDMCTMLTASANMATGVATIIKTGF